MWFSLFVWKDVRQRGEQKRCQWRWGVKAAPQVSQVDILGSPWMRFTQAPVVRWAGSVLAKYAHYAHDAFVAEIFGLSSPFS